MKHGRLSQAHPMTILLLWLLVIAIAFIGFICFTQFFRGISATALMRWSLVYQNIVIFILPALVVAHWRSAQPAHWLKLNAVPQGRVFGVAALVTICSMPLNNLLGYINRLIKLPPSLHPLEELMQSMEESSAQALQVLLDTSDVGLLLLNIFIIAILAGIGEEFTFRGVLQGLLTSDKFGSSRAIPHMAIWATAFLFSAIHMQFYGFIPRMLMGAFFGYALVWSGSIWVPILMHSLNNAIVVVLTYIAHQKQLDPQVLDNFGTGDTLWVGVCSLLLTIGAFYLLRRSTTISSASSRTSIGN